jgi:hypothetical protein
MRTSALKTFDNLGRDQIIAAILGGHDLMTAYCEISEPLSWEASLISVFGAWHCLQLCTEALSRAGLLPTLPDQHYNDFLHANAETRIAAGERCCQTNDIQELNRLVGLMCLCIEPYKDRFTFNDRAPHLTC